MKNSTKTIDRNLLRKYDYPGPRYTSYPTVPEWSADFGPDDYLRELNSLADSRSTLSLYVHIPFCRSRCYYCGCNTIVAGDPGRVDKYLDLLDREIALVSKYLKSPKRVVQLHWGGGTPTFLNPAQIKKLFKSISGYFHLEAKAEKAIEVDPRVTTTAQLNLLRRLGFNRISMGVQDLTPEVQKAIGRNQTTEETQTLFDQCRRLKFDGINIDLIYGLPGQNVENFAGTIDKIVEMGADRVAVYSFAYLPKLKSHQKLIAPEMLPSTAAKYDLFATAVEKFLEAGYIQIGMDHFAKPQDELARALRKGRLHRNFMGYTTRPADNSLGFGMSGISEMSGAFAQNLSVLQEYENKISAGKLATLRGYHLSPDDLIRQRAIMSLMCNFTLSFDALDGAFEIDSRRYFELEIKDTKQFIEDGLMEVTDTAINVTPRGRVFVRNIAMVFDAYLRGTGKEKGRIFSRTI